MEAFEYKSNRNIDLEQIRVLLNKEIINGLMKALKLNHDDIMAFTDETSGVSNKPKKLHKYEKVREVADIFGIPAWNLLTEREEDNIITHSQRESEELLLPYKLSSLADLLHSFETEIEHINLNPLTERPELQRNISSSWKIIRDNEDWSIIWKDIYNYIREGFIEEEFKWAGNLLFVKGHKVTHTATLRVFKQKIKNLGVIRRKVVENEKREIKNAWLLMKTINNETKQPSLLNKILVNISELFGNNLKPNLTLESIDMTTNLFSWHSLYGKEKIEMSQLVDVFNKKTKKISSVSEVFLFKVHDFFYYHPSYPDLHKIKSNSNNNDLQFVTNKLSDELKEDHKLNTLEFLSKRGYLKEGSRITFNYQNKYPYSRLFPSNDPFWFATIVNIGGKKTVWWEYDQEFYHLTPLSNKILKMIGVNNNIKHGAKLWCSEGIPEDLYSFTTTVKKNEITHDGYISLF